MNLASTRGLAVDLRLGEWNEWSTSFVLRGTEEPGDHSEAARTRTDEIYQMVIAGSLVGTDGDQGESSRRLKQLLLAARQDDGRWHGQGQLPDQRRPLEETHEVTTLWALHALDLLGYQESATVAAVKKAESLISEESTSVEHLAGRLLLAVGSELDSVGRRVTDQAVQALVDAQQENGGWGWLLDDPAGPMATGQAMYALALSRTDAALDACSRGTQFLLASQAEDGSWPTASTLSRKDREVYEVATDWGTAWAVIGLATANSLAPESPVER